MIRHTLVVPMSSPQRIFSFLLTVAFWMRLSLPPGPSSARRLPAPRAPRRGAAFELREHLASPPHARRVLLLVQPVAFGLLPQESPEDGRVELAVLRVVAVQQDSLVVGNEEPVVHLQDHRRNPLPDVQDQ